MTTNIRCPHCSTVLRVPSTQPGATFRCPKCSQTIRLGAASQNAPTASSPAAPRPAAPQPAAPAASSFPQSPSGFASPAMPRSPAASSGPAAAVGDTPPLRPFLIRWGIGLGIGTVLLVGFGLAGLAAEPVAFAASITMVVAMVACLLVGQVWMAIAAARQHVLMGIAVLFVPMVGLVLGIIQKGRILRGTIIYVSCFVPAVLGLIFVAMYKARYTPAGRAAARTARMDDAQPQLEAMIRRTEEAVAADAPLVTAKFRYIQMGPGTPITAAQGDSILSPFQHYVKGSFRVDSQAKTVQFDYRGPQRLASQYRLLLYNRTQVGLTELPGG